MSLERGGIKQKADAFCSDVQMRENRSFALYPFSNEYNCGTSIHELNNIHPINTDRLRVAILVGESHFISLLPELQKHADVIIFNDINKDVHTHLEHMLMCLNTSNSIKEFKENYRNKHPIVTKGEKWYSLETVPIEKRKSLWSPHQKQEISIDVLCDRLNNDYKFFGEHKEKFFLDSEERFQQCKQAAKSLSFTHSSIDMLNVEQCRDFNLLINRHNAKITVLNMTNLHSYDRSNKIPQVLNELKINDTCTVLYSTGKITLGSNLTSTIGTCAEYIDYLKMLVEKEHQADEMRRRQISEERARMVSINFLNSLHSKSEEGINNLISEFVEGIKQNPGLFVELFTEIQSNLKENPQSEKYIKAKNGLSVLSDMYGVNPDMAPLCIIKLDVEPKRIFTQLIELNSKLKSENTASVDGEPDNTGSRSNRSVPK